MNSGPGIPALHVEWEGAEVRTEGSSLIASTGRVERVWQWTGKGFVTTGLRNLLTGREWATLDPSVEADWDHADSSGELVELTATPVRFDPFTSDHLEVVAGIRYPSLAVRFVVWIYPDSPGLRTQLFVKARPGFEAPALPGALRVDHIAVSPLRLTRRPIGYYNYTQQRNTRETELLREEVRATAMTGEEIYDWASLLCLEDGAEGLAMVKESHKCVNQYGVDTGEFQLNKLGLVSSGWGPSPADYRTDRYRACWASWTIVYDGSADGRELAIKTFDRQRFPLDPSRDIYIMANTWGSGDDKQESRDATHEGNVLRQIEACADLGIDVQQIDDGWQGDMEYESWAPVKSRYPEGWKNVRQHAREAGVRLGLWGTYLIDEASLVKSFDEGGFRYYKIDFAQLGSFDRLEALVEKMRRLIIHSGHAVRVNWDVTKVHARLGYYYARDLGNIYLENRKPRLPESVVYTPYLVLRDAWHVARYTNLNSVQITVQNIERVDREASNAYLYNHAYTVAIALMASPLFFQEVSYYTPEARDQIRPLLTVYKQHRESMYRGYVFPIGEEPDDASWCGFQNHDADTASGYLTIFRELHAADPRQAIVLRFLAGKTIRLVDLERDVVKALEVPADGKVWFEIERPAGYRFYQYEVA